MNDDTINQDNRMHNVAAELDGLVRVPDELLLTLVTREGACMELYHQESEPEWSGDELTDQAAACRICADCQVQRECLELQLRTTGVATSGVWGALPDGDVRALFPVWRSRRRRQDPRDGECR